MVGRIQGSDESGDKQSRNHVELEHALVSLTVVFICRQWSAFYQ